MTQEALKLALNALEYHASQTRPIYQTDQAITAIKEALAQPEQEPVAWITPSGEGFRIRFTPPTSEVSLGWDALYTHPPQRTWVGLTKKEILLVNEKQDESIIAAPDDELIQFARAIEAKHKQKNGYAEEKNT